MLANIAPITILGGSGFVGSRLAAHLAGKHLPFRIGDIRISQAFPEQSWNCDVRDATSMRSVISGCRTIINLAAEHRDDVQPVSRYYATNVQGAKEVCIAATESNVKQIIFTSSVAVYGFHAAPVDENGPFQPFHPYGQTKLEAEQVYIDWAREDPSRCLVIVRPTVIFGEGNRGNVYNLLRQIASGRFLMIGNGSNYKSMAYVENIASLIIYILDFEPGIHIFNYADTPDLNMSELVSIANKSLQRTPSHLPHIPLPMAMAGGYFIDFIARLTGRTFPISALRIRKFCESTQFNASHIRDLGFNPPFDLTEGLIKTMIAEFKK